MHKRFENKKIILGICGGIAAYKSVELARFLQQEGAFVQVVMTESAQDFIGAQTFQAVTGFPVWSATNDNSFERGMAHIDLSRWADWVIIAPATANFMAKMTYGMADDLLSLICLMVTVPIMVCPAMNVHMWQHPATLQNTKVLQERGVYIIGPDNGSQACGDLGAGRMREPEWIMNAIDLLPIYNILQGQSYVLTAGPTRETIDPVRFISNRSSGIMGYALAEALSFAGAKVVMVSGPCHLPIPPGVESYFVNTAQEMFESVQKRLKSSDIFIGVAAVSDYKVSQPSQEKIKKSQNKYLNLELEQGIDILARVKQQKLAKHVVGFAAETQHVLEYAKEKLEKKADVIIANRVSDKIGFEQHTNAVTILTQHDEIDLQEATKLIIAKQCVEFFKNFFNA